MGKYALGRSQRFSLDASSTQVDKAYDAGAITVLEGLDPVRKRPGMYIGSTGVKGLHHLVFEVVDNCVDEALAGHCNMITVGLNEDGSVEVQDDGRGIPCGIHPVTGKSALETVLCVLHAGGKFGGDDSGYKVSGGLHGVGISVVNALSERLDIEVNREGNSHRMHFKRGLPQSGLEVTPSPSPMTGTRVVFKPDPEIFKTTTDFEYDRLRSRIDELAYLNAGLTIKMMDRRSRRPVPRPLDVEDTTVPSLEADDDDVDDNDDDDDEEEEEEEYGAVDHGRSTSGLSGASAPTVKEEVFRHDGGIAELVTELCKGKTILHEDVDVIAFQEERKGVTVDVALRWSRDLYSDAITGFANGIRTSDGGSHMDGLKAAITKVLNAAARKAEKPLLKEGQPNIPGEFVREGLTAVVSVKVPEPEFEGQTKTRLGNPEVRQIVDGIVQEGIQAVVDFNPALLTQIVGKAQAAQAAAAAARAARDMVRRKTLLTSTVLPGKLADCSSKDPSESEIYIVEGDSAAGSAKQGRDRATQAILPLRGKILNIEKASTEKIYANTELQALISALGLGVRGTDFDPSTLRYHRIVIMTDADVDGAHIRLLLLTFLYRYQKELIENGFVYIACPPLYKVTGRRGGKSDNALYFYTQEELDEHLAQRTSTGNPVIQRFKGLGEMMPTQLWETTMDPAKRTLKLVTIDDAVAADSLFTVLMGDNVMHRKNFINDNAEKMKLEDLDF